MSVDIGLLLLGSRCDSKRITVSLTTFRSQFQHNLPLTAFKVQDEIRFVVTATKFLLKLGPSSLATSQQLRCLFHRKQQHFMTLVFYYSQCRGVKFIDYKNVLS